MRTQRASLIVIATVLSLCILGAAQDAQSKDLDEQIESARADLRADKAEVIIETMKFTPQESSAFWPVYHKYETEQRALNDQRIALVKSYADKYTSLTDAEAKQMTEKSFELDAKQIDLKKKYCGEFSEKLSPTTVARFFQLEHRMDVLVDLKVASELPLMLDRSLTIHPGADSK